MSKEDSQFPIKDGLDFEEMKGLTVEQAVQKDTELKVGITENDSVLDRYIKQNREAINSKKFESSYPDTQVLDDFIKKQREELSKAGALKEESFEVGLDRDGSDTLSAAKEDLEATKVIDWEYVGSDTQQSKSVSDVATEPPLPASYQPADEFVLGEDTSSANKSMKGWIMGALIAIVALIFGLGYWYNQSISSAKSTVTKTATSSSSKPSSPASSASKAKANAEAFDAFYARFFTDTSQTKLKNSQFSQLTD